MDEGSTQVGTCSTTATSTTATSTTATSTTATSTTAKVIDPNGLQTPIDVLGAFGYTVIGPAVRQGAIANAPIRSIEDLPRG